MKRLLATSLCLLSLFSCTFRNVNNTLSDIESYIMERPDSALVMLESIDRGNLGTARIKAHHALLYAMALDKNYIDVTEDSIAKVATEYYLKHGPRRNYARALYYLGKSYYYNEEYDKAILEYSKAEKVAERCDSLYLGMIYSGKSYTYNCNYNSSQESLYAQKAYDIFLKLNIPLYTRSSLFRMAVSYHNNDEYENALSIYNRIITESTDADFCLIHSILGQAHTMLELANPDYYAIDNLFREAHYDYNAELEERDYWAWAYTLYKIGKETEANSIIANINNTDGLIASFWKSRISVITQKYDEAYKWANIYYAHQDKTTEEALEESLATYQQDYYKSQMELAENQVKTRTIELIAVVASSLLLLFILYLVISIYLRKQRVEKERLLEYTEEIKRQLIEAEKKDYPALKRKYISLYKSRFETIGSLSEQYIQAEGRIDIESIMYKKVLKLINDIKKDYLNRAKFEAMLDEDLDMIMTNLRKEMPKFSETDYSIFSYIVVGFDATTISRLIDMSVNNVYTHKHRIRTRIEKYQPEHASQFLEMLI
mgnify:CR=1 FL=1